jgi:hypothetical protein
MPGTINNNIPDPLAGIKNTSSSIINTLFGSDTAVLITLIGLFVIVGIAGTIGFEVILPGVRTQFANNVVALIAGLGFMFLILQFAGTSISFQGIPIDVGMLLYIIIIGGVVIAFSG